MLLITSHAAKSLETVGFIMEAHANFDYLQLLASLSVLALSEVFRHGAKMREEQELAV